MNWNTTCCIILCVAEFLWIWRPVQWNMESLLRERHHSLEELRLQKSRFTVGVVLLCQSRPSRRFTLWIYSHLCRPQVCFRDAFFSLLPRMRYGLFYNTPLVSYFWQMYVGSRVNLHARLPTPDPSRAFANCQVSKFQCTSHCNSGFSISFQFLRQICFLIFPARAKHAFQFRCTWKNHSCLSYLNDNSREIIVKLIQYKYVLSCCWRLEAWNIDRLASGRCFWLFLQHTPSLYSCAVFTTSAQCCVCEIVRLEKCIGSCDIHSREIRKYVCHRHVLQA